MQFYTAHEAARLLRVKKAYIYEMVAQGRLKALRLSKRRLRIPEESLQELVEKETGRTTAN